MEGPYTINNIKHWQNFIKKYLGYLMDMENISPRDMGGKKMIAKANILFFKMACLLPKKFFVT